MNESKPLWYKNPIVWMVIFFPSLAVIAGFITLFIAIESDDGLVDSEYYKQGLGINKTISNDSNAIKHNISGLLSINAASGAIQAKFSDSINSKLSESIAFKIVHRTIPGFDQKVKLHRTEDTLLYVGQIEALPKQGGRWRWEIKDTDWRISERFSTKQNEVIIQTFPKKQ